MISVLLLTLILIHFFFLFFLLLLLLHFSFYSDIVINLIGKHYETKHVVPTRRADGKISRINYTYDVSVQEEVKHWIPLLAYVDLKYYYNISRVLEYWKF